MAAQGGISGVAVGMATAGAFLLYIGIQGVSIRDGLKAVTGGHLPQGKARDTSALTGAAASLAGATGGSAAASAAAGVAGANAPVVTAARKYKGVPYAWGGTSAKGLDCSGLVVKAFQDAYGVTPPRTTYTQVAWKQLTGPVGRGQIAAGDLCFWPSFGPPSHVAIAVDADTVIHAPRPGKVVAEVPITQAFTGGSMPVVYRYIGSK
jgi:cell wall-associated NlpC family hydrolase